MAPIHQTTFQGIVEHLSRVAAQSGHNKMDAKVSCCARIDDSLTGRTLLLFSVCLL